MTLLSESRDVLPVHRKILAFSFIGWIIYNVSRGVQFLAPVVITFVASRSTFGAGIALAAPFALLAGATVWALPETKGVRLAKTMQEPSREIA